MSKTLKIITTLAIIFLLFLIYLYITIFASTNAKNYPITIEVESGESLNSISSKLKENHIISNKFVFESLAKILNKDSKIKLGEYTFKRPTNDIEILSRLVSADYQYFPVVVTIKEGEDYRNIVDKIYDFKNVNKNYTKDQLIDILKSKEGYLFPETYNFAPFATLENILNKIDSEFTQRVKNKYNLSDEELKKVLTIASILEKEVQHPEDMKIVSGIIQNRLSKGMPLQMDSTLGYFTGKASLELTRDDLRLDSSFNTYKVKGLPSGPIGNPGDVAIEAAINPDKNDYLFFLSDKGGVNHYAKTYAEHLKNRRMYLNK